MSRLLNAGFKRLIKDKVFWICIFIFITIGITRCWAQYNEMIKYNAIVKIDNIIFNAIVIIDFAIPIFVCLFVGTDYSDGTIRNKIIAGTNLMSIWFYVSIIILIGILISLIIKIALIKKSVNEITSSVDYILKSDTNNLITISSSDKDIRELTSCLNESLKNLREQKIEYQNGNNTLKRSITNI